MFRAKLGESGTVFLEKNTDDNAFLLFRNYLPSEREAPSFDHPRMLCDKLCWNWPSGSEEEFFFISSMYFCYFVIISPWKRVGPFIWINLNPYHTRMLCAKFGWNWPSGSGEEDENVKSLRQRQRRQRRTTDFWSEKLTWAFGTGELKINNNDDNGQGTHFDQRKLVYAFGSGELKSVLGVYNFWLW